MKTNDALRANNIILLLLYANELYRLVRKPKKAEIWEIFTIIISCKKYDFYVLVYYSPDSDDKIMIDTSLNSAWSCEDMKGSIEKIGRKMKVGCQVEVGSK